MPDLAVAVMQPLPLWTAAALLFLLLIISIVALRRSGSFGSVAALFGVPALVVIAWSAWNFTDHAILQQRAAERDALNARAAQLAATATAPGSVLACLDADASLAEACEQTLFQRPETVAAAKNYTEARLHLLADSLDDYVKRAGRSYDRLFVALRHSLEADRYGFVAHVLATRESCTAESCAAFGWFNDTATIKANIAAQALENNIARHAAHWQERKSPPLAQASPPEAAPVATLSAAPVFKPIDFPSAASIPAVSIMTESPTAAAAPPPAEAAPTPPRRPAAPAPTPARPR